MTKYYLSLIYSLGFKILGLVGALFISITIARLLGATELGIYVFLVRIYGLLVILSLMGADNYIVQQLSGVKYDSLITQTHRLRKNLTDLAFRIYLIITLLTCSIIIFSPKSSILYNYKFESILFLGFTLITGINIINTSILVSREKYWLANLLRDNLPSIILASSLSFIFFLVEELNLIILLTLFVISRTIVWLISSTIVKDYITKERIQDKENYLSRIKILLPFALISLSHVIYTQSDIILIGVFSNNSDKVGFYSVCIALSGLVELVFTVSFTMLSNKIGQFLKNNEILRLKKFALQTTFLYGSIAVIISLFFWLFAEFILNFWGDEFIQLRSLLVLLCLAKIFRATFGVNQVILLMGNKQKTITRNMIVAASLNLVGNLILIPIIGPTGAAITTIFSSGLEGIMNLIGSKKILNEVKDL